MGELYLLCLPKTSPAVMVTLSCIERDKQRLPSRSLVTWIPFLERLHLDNHALRNRIQQQKL